MIAPLPDDEPERLEALRRYRIFNSPPDEALDEIAQLASDICDTPICVISFIDELRQWFKAKVGMDAAETHRDLSFCSHAILDHQELLIVPNAAADHRFHDNPSVTGDPGVRFYAGASLVTEDGHAIGTICVVDMVPREMTPRQQRALRSLAKQVVAQLELRLRLAEQDEWILNQQRLTLALKQTEDRLNEANERLRLATESGELGVWEYNAKSQKLTWNEQMMRLYGFTPDTFPGAYEAWSSRLHPDDRARSESELGEALGGGRKFDTEFQIVLPDGTVRDVKADAIVIDGEDGRPSRMIGLNQDITLRKRADEALRESEWRFRLAIDAMHEGFALQNDKGEITVCNVRAEQILGLKAGEISGCTPMDPRWRSIHEDGSPFPAETYPAVLAFRDGQGRQNVVMGIHKPDGDLVWVSVNAIPIFHDRDARPYSVVVTFTDITKRRWLEDRVQDQVQQTKSANARLEAQQVELAAANVRLQSLAKTDGLTGLLNHQAFHEDLATEYERSRRHRHPLSVLMLDVDKFKDYNDTFGHPAGDDVLRKVASILLNTARTSDIVARYGGEEFAIVLTDTDEHQSRLAAERFRHAIESFAWGKRSITASFGITTLSPRTQHAQSLVEEADRCLYQSKRAGRNRVTQQNDLTVCERNAREQAGLGLFK